jgi:hypothetical protein
MLQIIQFIIDLGFVYFASYTYFARNVYFPWAPNAGICAGEGFAAFAGQAILELISRPFHLVLDVQGGILAEKL